MDPLILKLLLTPTLVLLVALAQQRLGETIGGRLAALPLTSGPLVLVVLCDQGAPAARAVVAGILTGVPAAAVFFAVYATLADRLRWWTCLLSATAASVRHRGRCSPHWRLAGWSPAFAARSALARAGSADARLAA